MENSNGVKKKVKGVATRKTVLRFPSRPARPIGKSDRPCCSRFVWYAGEPGWG